MTPWNQSLVHQTQKYPIRDIPIVVVTVTHNGGILYCIFYGCMYYLFLNFVVLAQNRDEVAATPVEVVDTVD